ncbi:MAG: tyrosine--tRNA ligase, partial [Candidatus Pacebacteria bacterium]|nr:tyrosine--tRNA ligase [Candidatus Paceibacterota bacterium]
IPSEQAFVEQFQKKIIPENVLEISVKDSLEILDLLVEIGLTKSKGEARRKIDEGAVKIDDEKITDQKYAMDFGDKTEKIIKLGRKIIKIYPIK